MNKMNHRYVAEIRAATGLLSVMLTKLAGRLGLCAAAIACAGMFATSTAQAQELRVDFNMNGRAVAEGIDPSYTAWSTNSVWLTSSTNSISNSFGGITIIFTRMGAQGVGIKSDYWKEGITTPGYNAKAVNDGITVDTGNAGAQIEMRIRGLSAGNHTLLNYLNTWQNPATHSFSPLTISVNGTVRTNNQPVSNRVTNNADAAISYLTVTATAGQDVVVLFAANTGGSETDKNVCLDAFEIDTPDPRFAASKPFPTDRDEHVTGPALSLAWAKANTAVSHNVYFGTSSNAVYNATTASAEYKGNQASTNYAVSSLSSLNTYFWRIDEVATGGVVTKGRLWYFRTRHLAFPGAEGYGRFARGGRGGVVVEVSNLNDSGAGSLRDALTGNYGPRTVVFTVGGLITLESDLIINGNNPYVTLAGQTAPGKGICTRKYQLGVSGGKDLIIRHVRSRPGNLAGVTLNGSGLSGADNSIMDHVSISWGIDEELSTRSSKNVTFQKSLISEALNIAGHQNYPAGTEHGYAATIGGDIGSFHHNLLAHNEGRNWSLGGGLDAAGFLAGRLDIFNNVVYNWGGRTTDGGAHEVNFVNNYYKTGAASSFFYALSAQYDDFPGTQQYYFEGNVMPGRFQTSNETAGKRAVDGTGSVPTSYSPWVSSPFFASFATIQEVTNAFKVVLSDVGCNQPQLDDHDKRVIMETRTGTYTYTGTGPYGGSPGLPNSQDDVGGWENYPTTSRPANFDTDHDGLPDWWERLKGLPTNSAAGDFSNAKADLVGDEYTEIDRYVNWMADLHVTTTVDTTVDVILTNMSAGFGSGAAYSVSGAVNGTVSIVNGNTARFVPTSGFSGLGSYRFTVTEGQYIYTNAIGVAVIGAAVPAAPASPTALLATGGNAVVNLTWVQSVSSGITQNKVYRSTTGSGGTYSLLTTFSATTSHSDTTVVNGNSYFYVVTAVNVNGESGFSAYSGATPSAPAAPAAPTGLGATAGNAQVSLSWTASSGATSYRIKRATVSGGPYSNIATNTSVTYTNTGLVNGTTYYYVVSAVNAVGESANSSQVSATPTATVLPAPTFVAAGSSTSGSGTLTPALPSGVAANDILLLFIETANQAVAISSANGGTWTEVTGSPQGTGTAAATNATRLTVFWSRYNGTQGVPTVSDSGDHQVARMIAIRGATASGNPWDVTAGGVETTSDTSASVPGATTIVANTLVVAALAGSLPDSSTSSVMSGWANANLTSVTERVDNATSNGNGGLIGVATGVKATAGAYGNTTATHSSAAIKGLISIAIKP